MARVDRLEALFIGWAFFFQAALICHFALRRWAFEIAMRYGWIVYALGAVAAAVSVILLLGRMPWAFWLGGFICLAWAVFGYVVEYVLHIEWRSPVRWAIFGPYVCLYLATIMFYWWPLGQISRPLWFAYAGLFVIGTVLNVMSHRGATHIG